MTATAGPTVIACVVTTLDRGVLVEKRRDQTPPWGFPAREATAGEDAETTAALIVLAETGVAVTPLRVLGERVHPGHGNRHITYVACQANSTALTNGDPDALEEIRWLKVSEVHGIMPDMFDEVSAYLDGLAQEDRS